MRSIAAVLMLVVLTACGQQSAEKAQPPAQTSTAAAVPAANAWRAALTDNPDVVHTFAGTALGVVSGSHGTPTAAGLQITTPANVGAWAAMQYFGPGYAAPRQLGLRIHVHVTTGALFFLTTYENAPRTAVPFQIAVPAGEATTIWLPIDQAGRPILVVANGTNAGASTGVVQSIELVGAPAPH